jgi:hypothetical protein
MYDWRRISLNDSQVGSAFRGPEHADWDGLRSNWLDDYPQNSSTPSALAVEADEVMDLARSETAVEGAAAVHRA